MASNYRLRTIRDLKPGDHLCSLYKTEEEHRALLTPFLREGLERGEKVVYVVDVHSADDILDYLRDDGLGVEHYLASGQLSIRTSHDAYVPEGNFDPDKTIAFLRAETERAVAQGYSALRVTGEMSWALGLVPGSERLVEYESNLNTFFPGSKCLGICQYDLRRFDSAWVLDVLPTHPIAVLGTEVCDNFYFMPPDDFLGFDVPGATLRQWITNLATRKRMLEMLRDGEERYRLLFNSCSDAMFVYQLSSGGMRDRLIDVNGAACEKLGYTRNELLGLPPLALVAPERLSDEPELRKKLLAEKHVCFDTTIATKHGRKMAVEISANLFDLKARPTALCVARDITERKRAEERRKKEARSFPVRNGHD